MTGPVEGPTFGSISMPEYSLYIIDPATGLGPKVVTGTIGDLAPSVSWNDESTHFVVLWPQFAGL